MKKNALIPFAQVGGIPPYMFGFGMGPGFNIFNFGPGVSGGNFGDFSRMPIATSARPFGNNAARYNNPVTGACGGCTSGGCGC